jgi:hypothetical protein
MADREHWETDLGRCLPSARLATRYARGRWKVIPYATGNTSGNMLLAPDESHAGAVRLPLRLRGRYDVFLGLLPCNLNGTGLYGTGLCGIRVRLTGEPCFRNILSLPEQGNHLHEVFWKQAVLNGRSMEFLPVGRRKLGGAVSGIAYVRLVPARRPAPSAPVRPWLGGFIDGDLSLWFDRKTTKADIESVLEPFRGSPFRKIYWGFAVGDTRWYQLRGGSHPMAPVYLSGGYRNIAESVRSFHKAGIDVLRVARDCAKRLGLEFHLYHRPGFISAEPPLDEAYSSRFVLSHPELALCDRDGTRLSQLSYAFPAVQDRILGLFAEHLRYGVDGLNLCFHRGVPMTLFEAPVVEGFRRRYGVDPRKVADDDSRLIRFRSEIVTAYLRRVRQLLDAGQKKGKRLELAATVLMTRAANRHYGLDVARWAHEGIVDVLIPYLETRGLPDAGGIELAWFKRVVRGTRCQLAPELLDVRSWLAPEKHYRERAAPFHRAGVDGICFWDVDARTDKPLDWEIIQGLARPRSFERSIRLALRRNRRVPLQSLGGVRVDRTPTMWAL